MSDEVSTNDDGKHAILTERRGTTFVVTINRPEVRNALDEPTASALAQALREFDRNDALGVAARHYRACQ
jgi:enoyl-CoA hydratase